MRAAVGKVLWKTYDEFYFKSHSKYRLPFVKKEGVQYSGFNMGAGENALFEIFYNLNVCPEGTLAIIDEIELGLHQEAQKRLIAELKSICLSRKIQIICTTHSPAIICELPELGRFYIESQAKKTNIIPGVSGEFATGKLSGDNSCELFLYVEDNMAVSIVGAALGRTLRSRVRVLPIGSDAAIVTILAGKRKEGLSTNYLGVFDGDKRSSRSKQIKLFLKRLESFEDKAAELAWIQQRIIALPGDSWPERWVISKVKVYINQDLEEDLGATSDEILEAISWAEQAEKHSEVFEFSKKMHMGKALAEQILCVHVARNYKDEFAELIQAIGDLLDQTRG